MSDLNLLGVLASTFPSETEALTSDEYRTLKICLKILQRKDWLANWLELEIRHGWLDRPATPAQVIESLIEPLQHFAADIEQAKELTTAHPELFADCSRVVVGR